MEQPALVMRGITKSFAGFHAIRDVDLEIEKGTIHCLLGENGAGKSTLMNCLAGLYRPDRGKIFLFGEEKEILSPADALRLGIGMVHQHFKLIEQHTVLENILLGLPDNSFVLNISAARKRLREVASRFNLDISPDVHVSDLDPGEKQRVEILKMLYRNIRILILDEPTAVLTPQEVEGLFITLKKLTAGGITVIFITHKLREVLRFSDRVTVLRGGKVAGSVETGKISTEILAAMMVGERHIAEPVRKSVTPGDVILELENVSTSGGTGSALRNISFSIRAGEIFGVAGVSGNGQIELAEVVNLLKKPDSGRLFFRGRELSSMKMEEFIKAGAGYIPAERLKSGLAANYDIPFNMLMKETGKGRFGGRFIIDWEAARSYSLEKIKEFEIKVASVTDPVKLMSGGNLQKLILARETARSLALLTAVYPVRGLDISATCFIHRKLIELAEKGTAILLISEDLDEILSLADRIAVMFEGRFIKILSRQEATVEEIGLLMAGQKKNAHGTGASAGEKVDCHADDN